jgi:hypothetical protein
MTREMTMEEIRARLAGLQLYAIFMRPTDKYDTQSEEGRELMRRHAQVHDSLAGPGQGFL